MRGPTRLTAYVAAATLALTGPLFTTNPAQAVTHDDIGQTQGATWLEGQLTNGLFHNPNFGGFDDYGLSIDAALALFAVGNHEDAVSDVSDALAANIGSYIGTGSELYAGSTAKAAVLADVAGDDPTAFGGVDLVAKLESTVSSTAPIAGRIEDQSAFGDFANTLGQALATRALTTEASSDATSARDFLLEQQCPNGSFRLNFAAKSANDQSCQDNTQADTDATAFTVLQIQGLTGTTQAVADAKAWLLSVQRTDGSWGGGPSTEGSNANSTGLAAWALGDTPDSEQAAQWLRDHQATPLDACNKLGASSGAIAYDDAARSAGRSEGITDASSDQWRRATSQAVVALAYLPAKPSAALSLTGPAGFRKAGGAPVLSTVGAPAATQLCLTGANTRIRRTPTTDPWNVAVTLPAGTANRVYTVRDAYGHSDTATVKVLGKKTLDVRTSTYRVKRSAPVTVVLRGLAPGERTSVYYRGHLVKSGTATSLGRFAAHFKAVRVLGKQAVIGYGQFHDIRRGTAQIKVVR